MIREFNEHPAAYVVLSLCMVAGVLGFFAVWPHYGWQRLIAVGMGCFYVLWGMATHVKTSRLTRRVISEYAAVGLLATLFLILVTI